MNLRLQHLKWGDLPNLLSLLRICISLMGADMLHLHFGGYQMSLPAESSIDSRLSSWQLLALPPKLFTEPLLLCLCYSVDGKGGGGKH